MVGSNFQLYTCLHKFRIKNISSFNASFLGIIRDYPFTLTLSLAQSVYHASFCGMQRKQKKLNAENLMPKHSLELATVL